jgi:hypothetical protein
MINEENYGRFIFFRNEHIHNGGKFPLEAALTELVKICILERNYKIYYGGGYEYHKHKEFSSINVYDVVCYFGLTGDPYFMVCMNNEQGDCCELSRCNSDCMIESKLI